jgi:RNA recognition motif-containing protein
MDNSPAVSVFVSFHAKSPDITVTDETIRQDFARFGDIIDVAIRMILKDKYYNFQKGYAFVSFPDNSDGMESAINAIREMNNVEYNGIQYKCEPSRRLGQRLGLADPPRHQRHHHPQQHHHHQQQQQQHHQQQQQQREPVQSPTNSQGYGNYSGASTSASGFHRPAQQHNQRNQQNYPQQQPLPHQYQRQQPFNQQQALIPPSHISMFPSATTFSPPSHGQTFFPPPMMRYPDGQVMPGQLIGPSDWQVNSQYFQPQFPPHSSHAHVHQNQSPHFAISSSSPPYPSSYGMSLQSTNFTQYVPPNSNFVQTPSYTQQMVPQVPPHPVPPPQVHPPSAPRMQQQSQSNLGYKTQPPRYN